MLAFLKSFERFIIMALLCMMVLVVLLSTVQLGWVLIDQMAHPPRYIALDFEELTHIFGFFLAILIGIELLETIKMYIEEDRVNVQVMFLVAMIAVTRKVVILDIKEMTPLGAMSIASLILALSLGYFLLKKSGNSDRQKRVKKDV